MNREGPRVLFGPNDESDGFIEAPAVLASVHKQDRQNLVHVLI